MKYAKKTGRKTHELHSRFATADQVFRPSNAVTRFADHERKAGSNDLRLQASWFGAGARLKRDAYANALALLD